MRAEFILIVFNFRVGLMIFLMISSNTHMAFSVRIRLFQRVQSWNLKKKRQITRQHSIYRLLLLLLL